jgi:hypothetical protein
MPTDEITIRLFYMVDNQITDVNKRSDAHLYPSEIVMVGLLAARKGGRFRAFYRWLDANYRTWFPNLPERSPCSACCAIMLTIPSIFWPNRRS